MKAYSVGSMKRDEEGFYLCDESGEFYMKARLTDEAVIFKRFDQEDTCRINNAELVSVINHDEPVKPFPTKRLKDVVSVFVFWISMRQQWIGFLFTFTDDFVDLKEDYPEKRVYYSPPYLASTDDIGMPTIGECEQADEAGRLVKRNFSYEKWRRLLKLCDL